MFKKGGEGMVGEKRRKKRGEERRKKTSLGSTLCFSLKPLSKEDSIRD